MFVSVVEGLRFKFRASQLSTVLPTARHRRDISLEEAVLPGRNNVETGRANS